MKTILIFIFFCQTVLTIQAQTSASMVLTRNDSIEIINSSLKIAFQYNVLIHNDEYHKGSKQGTKKGSYENPADDSLYLADINLPDSMTLFKYQPLKPYRIFSLDEPWVKNTTFIYLSFDKFNIIDNNKVELLLAAEAHSVIRTVNIAFMVVIFKKDCESDEWFYRIKGSRE